MFEADDFAVEDEFGVVDEGHAVGLGEGFGAGAYEVDVWAFVEDEAGGLDGIAEVFDAGYAAGAEGGSVHEEGVELDAAVSGEEGAAAGVEGGVVFEDGDGGFYGVGGGASTGEDGVAGGEGVGNAALVVCGHFRGDGPGTAVDQEDWGSSWHWVLGYMVGGGIIPAASSKNKRRRDWTKTCRSGWGSVLLQFSITTA